MVVKGHWGKALQGIKGHSYQLSSQSSLYIPDILLLYVRRDIKEYLPLLLSLSTVVCVISVVLLRLRCGLGQDPWLAPKNSGDLWHHKPEKSTV